jgi:hypothetical protein
MGRLENQSAILIWISASAFDANNSLPDDF